MKIINAKNNNFVFFSFQFRIVNVVTIPKIAPDAPAEIIVPKNKFVKLVEIPVTRTVSYTHLTLPTTPYV